MVGEGNQEIQKIDYNHDKKIDTMELKLAVDNFSDTNRKEMGKEMESTPDELLVKTLKSSLTTLTGEIMNLYFIKPESLTPATKEILNLYLYLIEGKKDIPVDTNVSPTLKEYLTTKRVEWINKNSEIQARSDYIQNLKNIGLTTLKKAPTPQDYEKINKDSITEYFDLTGDNSAGEIKEIVANNLRALMAECFVMKVKIPSKVNILLDSLRKHKQSKEMEIKANINIKETYDLLVANKKKFENGTLKLSNLNIGNTVKALGYFISSNYKDTSTILVNWNMNCEMMKFITKNCQNDATKILENVLNVRNAAIMKPLMDVKNPNIRDKGVLLLYEKIHDNPSYSPSTTEINAYFGKDEMRRVYFTNHKDDVKNILSTWKYSKTFAENTNAIQQKRAFLFPDNDNADTKLFRKKYGDMYEGANGINAKIKAYQNIVNQKSNTYTNASEEQKKNYNELSKIDDQIARYSQRTNVPEYLKKYNELKQQRATPYSKRLSSYNTLSEAKKNYTLAKNDLFVYESRAVPETLDKLNQEYVWTLVRLSGFDVKKVNALGKMQSPLGTGIKLDFTKYTGINGGVDDVIIDTFAEKFAEKRDEEIEKFKKDPGGYIVDIAAVIGAGALAALAMVATEGMATPLVMALVGGGTFFAADNIIKAVGHGTIEAIKNENNALNMNAFGYGTLKGLNVIDEKGNIKATGDIVMEKGFELINDVVLFGPIGKIGAGAKVVAEKFVGLAGAEVIKSGVGKLAVGTAALVTEGTAFSFYNSLVASPLQTGVTVLIKGGAASIAWEQMQNSRSEAVKPENMVYGIAYNTAFISLLKAGNGLVSPITARMIDNIEYGKIETNTNKANILSEQLKIESKKLEELGYKIETKEEGGTMKCDIKKDGVVVDITKELPNELQNIAQLNASLTEANKLIMEGYNKIITKSQMEMQSETSKGKLLKIMSDYKLFNPFKLPEKILNERIELLKKKTDATSKSVLGELEKIQVEYSKLKGESNIETNNLTDKIEIRTDEKINEEHKSTDKSEIKDMENTYEKRNISEEIDAKTDQKSERLLHMTEEEFKAELGKEAEEIKRELDSITPETTAEQKNAVLKHILAFFTQIKGVLSFAKNHYDTLKGIKGFVDRAKYVYEIVDELYLHHKMREFSDGVIIRPELEDMAIILIKGIKDAYSHIKYYHESVKDIIHEAEKYDKRAFDNVHRYETAGEKTIEEIRQDIVSRKTKIQDKIQAEQNKLADLNKMDNTTETDQLILKNVDKDVVEISLKHNKKLLSQLESMEHLLKKGEAARLEFDAKMSQYHEDTQPIKQILTDIQNKGIILKDKNIATMVIKDILRRIGQKIGIIKNIEAGGGKMIDDATAQGLLDKNTLTTAEVKQLQKYGSQKMQEFQNLTREAHELKESINQQAVDAYIGMRSLDAFKKEPGELFEFFKKYLELFGVGDSIDMEKTFKGRIVDETGNFTDSQVRFEKLLDAKDFKNIDKDEWAKNPETKNAINTEVAADILASKLKGKENNLSMGEADKTISDFIQTVKEPGQQAILEELWTSLKVDVDDHNVLPEKKAIALLYSAKYLADYMHSSFAEGKSPTEIYLLMEGNQNKIVHQHVQDKGYLTGSSHDVLHILQGNTFMAEHFFDAMSVDERVLSRQIMIDHDLGYTSEFNRILQEKMKNMGLDDKSMPQYFDSTKDHPLWSAVAMEKNSERYIQYFGGGEKGKTNFQAMKNCVIDHSNAKSRTQDLPQAQPDDANTIRRSAIESVVSITDCLAASADFKSAFLFAQPELVKSLAELYKEVNVEPDILKMKDTIGKMRAQIATAPEDLRVSLSEAFESMFSGIENVLNAEGIDDAQKIKTTQGKCKIPFEKYLAQYGTRVRSSETQPGKLDIGSEKGIIHAGFEIAGNTFFDLAKHTGNAEMFLASFGKAIEDMNVNIKSFGGEFKAFEAKIKSIFESSSSYEDFVAKAQAPGPEGFGEKFATIKGSNGETFRFYFEGKGYEGLNEVTQRANMLEKARTSIQTKLTEVLIDKERLKDPQTFKTIKNEISNTIASANFGDVAMYNKINTIKATLDNMIVNTKAKEVSTSMIQALEKNLIEIREILKNQIILTPSFQNNAQ